MPTQYTAKLSFLRQAPRKVRSVGDLIKGLPVNEAEAQLLAQTRRPSKALLKLLRSRWRMLKTTRFMMSNIFLYQASGWMAVRC